MATLVLGIAAAIGSTWAVHNGTGNWLIAVGLTLFAWAFGAAAVLLTGDSIGLYSHQVLWGMVIGCGAMTLVFMRRS